MAEIKSQHDTDLMVDVSKDENSNSATPPVVCLSCGAELYTDFISAKPSSGVSIRCGRCGNFVGSGIQPNAPVDKAAWWSLWFGLSSMFLLFLTGIPAVYLGIRSLLRMRHTSSRLGDRRAAIGGTLFGTVFGIMGGFCFLGMAAVLVLTFWSRETTDEFAQAKMVLSGIANANLPEQLDDGYAIRAMNTHQFHFGDSKKNKERTCRVSIVHFPPAMVGGSATLHLQLKSHLLRKNAHYKQLAESTLDWEIANKRTTVFKYVLEETFEDDTGETVTNQVDQYVGFVGVEKGIYGVSCITQQPSNIFPDQKSVRTLFRSVTPVEELHANRAWEEARTMAANQEDRSGEQNDVN